MRFECAILVEYTVYSNAGVVRVFLKLGDGMLQFGKSSRWNCSDDMARLSDLVDGAVW